MLVLMPFSQCQQTAEYWIKLGNDLNSFEYVDVERNTEAAKAFDKAIDIDPSNKEAWMGLKDALCRIAVATNNEEDLRQAHNADEVYAHGTNMSDLRSAPALLDHSNRTSNKSVLAPQTVAEWIAFGNTTRFTPNGSERALAAYDMAIKLDPNLLIAWIARGNLLASMGSNDYRYYDEAVKSFDRAIDINPLGRDAWIGLEDALNGMGAYDDAYHIQDLLGNSCVVNLSDPRSTAAFSDYERRKAAYSDLEIETASNTTYPSTISSDKFKYATEYDVIDALNGAPYFDPSEGEVYDNSYGPIKVTLNMTSNTSDSESAARQVFEALFKYPKVEEVNVVCYKAAWDKIGELTIYIHDYTMTSANAKDVGDWINIDLRRYDLYYHDPPVYTSELSESMTRFGVGVVTPQ